MCSTSIWPSNLTLKNTSIEIKISIIGFEFQGAYYSNAYKNKNKIKLKLH